MNCKYCNSELRIRNKKIDGKVHRIAYCDECRLRWDLSKKQPIATVKALYVILIILIIIAVVLIKNTLSKQNADSQTESEFTSEDTTETTTEAPRQKSFTDLQTYLLDEGVITGTPDDCLYQLIGAKDGIKYPDTDIELYEYDMTSTEYQTIVSTMEINGIPVAAVNGPYVLIISNNGSNPTAVDVFNAY